MIDIGLTETVGQYPNQKDKRDVLIADNTGQITLTLWQKQCQNLTFNQDNVIVIENAVTSTFNNQIYITTSAETSINVVEEEIEVQATPAVKPKNTDVIATTVAQILAIKNFRCLIKCINCKKEIDFATLETTIITDVMVTCPQCNVTFLAQNAQFKNNCEIMLSTDKQWYTANSAVSTYMQFLLK